MKLHHKLYSGRINRASYFWSLLAISIFMGLAQTLQNDQKAIILIVLNLAMFVLFYLTISIWVRRLHDIDMSGWWALVIFAPVINILFYLVLLFKEGNIKKNMYGAKPSKGVRF